MIKPSSMKSLQTICLLLFISFTTFKGIAQQITGQILDYKTGEPIAFATIQYDDNNGVVSNMEGFFTLSREHIPANSKLTISFMGYQTEDITLNELEGNQFKIRLREAVNQLNTVYLQNKMPNVDSIMARAHRHLNKNYVIGNTKQTIFTRKTTYFKGKKIDVDITKSSGFKKSQLEDSNKQFAEMANQIVNSPPTQSFTDILFESYHKDNGIPKIQVKKATKLVDRKNNVSLEAIQSRVANIVLQHLDTSKTYKLKSGWFKIEDSLSLKSAKKTKKEVEDAGKNVAGLKINTQETLNSLMFKKDSELNFVTDIDAYEYELHGTTSIDDQLVYIVNFQPRRSRAKFKGQLFINDEDHAILKINYSYAEGKHGEKLNLRLLFGVKYVESVNDGTIIYRKNNASNAYYPYYVNQKSAKYLYAHRPLKFTENDDDSSNKIAFDLLVEGHMVEKNELMSLGNETLDAQSYANVIESTKIDYIRLKQYDPTLWKDYNILEPLEELKKFKVEE